MVADVSAEATTTDRAGAKDVASLDSEAADAEVAPKPVAEDEADAAAQSDKMSGESDAGQAIARAGEVGDDGSSVRIHTASFRSEKGAERDWQKL